MRKIRRWVGRLVLVAGGAYLLFLIAYIVSRVIFWDRLSPIAFLSTFVPWLVFPVFLLPLAALCARRRAVRISAVGVVLIAVVWLYASYWMPKTVAIAAGTPGVAVLTMNVGQHLVTPAAMQDYISQQNSDIVCMQEIIQPQVAGAWPALKSHYPYQVNSPLSNAANSTGIGVLSDVPIENTETFILREGSSLPQQRITLKFHGQEIALYNIHTTTPTIRSYAIGPLRIPNFVYADRIREANALALKLSQEKLPTILCGDLNMSEQSQDFATLRTYLGDSFRESGSGFGFTWPAHTTPEGHNFGTIPFVGIDHIMHSKEWVAQGARVMPPIGSDHLPVMTSLFLTP